MTSPDENGFGGGFVPFSQIQQAMASAHDQHRMVIQELRASIDRFFDEMTADQLFTFHRMMDYISDSDGGQRMAQYWSGGSAMLLRIKHKVCSGCGVAHDEAEHLFPSVNEAAPTEPKLEVDVDPSKIVASGEQYEAWLEHESQRQQVFTDEVDGQMFRYSVIPDFHDGAGLQVACKRCAAVFANLSRRMAEGEACPVCKASGKFDG